MKKHTPLNPELAALLGEIRSDPRSRIFRSVSDSRRDLASEPSVRVSEHSSGLTPAERELLSVHRDEAARLFRLAARARHAADEAGKNRITFHGELVDAGSWVNLASAELHEAERDDMHFDAHDALADCAARPLDEWPSARELAVASLGLVESDQARIYCALDDITHGQYQSARRVLGDMIALGTTVPMEWYCWQNLGLALLELGRYEDAQEGFAQAARHEVAGAEVFVNLVTNGVRVADEHGVHRGLERLEDHAGADAAIDQFCACASDWEPGALHGNDPAATAVLSRAKVVAGERTGRLLDALD